jgi:hypothetical protein
MFSKSFTNHVKGIDNRFTKFHEKFDEETLLDFAIIRRQNETRSRVKTIHVHSIVSHGKRMQ